MSDIGDHSEIGGGEWTDMGLCRGTHVASHQGGQVDSLSLVPENISTRHKLPSAGTLTLETVLADIYQL